ncbi:uncharacterized protein SAMN05660350_04896, partial [Geodermatophilus obscurus]
ELFAFFLENGFRSVAFNIEEAEHVHRETSLESTTRAELVEAYTQFFDRLFDLWWPHRHTFEIREFTDLAKAFQMYRADESYHHQPIETRPMAILTVTRSGDVSTLSPEFADYENVPQYANFVIGNIMDVSSLDELAHTSAFQRITQEAQVSVDMCRHACGFFWVCGSEFISNKFSEHGTLRATETRTCALHRKALASLLIEKIAAKGKLKQSQGD